MKLAPTGKSARVFVLGVASTDLMSYVSMFSQHTQHTHLTDLTLLA